MNSFHDKYQRLARDRFGLSSLWLGEDHLVYVKGSGVLMPFVEEYKRFRLSEIEAFTVAKTPRTGKTVLLVLILIACLAAASLLLALDKDPGPVSITFISLFFVGGLGALTLLLRHLILGPTCLCDIQTRLTRERLRPLNRYHRALETVRRIEELVRESQSAIVTSDVGEEPTAPRHRVRDDRFYQVPAVVPPTFGLFAALGLAALAALHLESIVLTGGILLLLMAASLLLSLALVSVVRKPTPESVRTVLWILLGLHFLVLGAGMVYYLVVATREPSYTVGLTGPLEAFTALASEGGMVLYGAFVGFFLGFVGVGLWGFAVSGKWRRQIRLAEALSQPDSDGGGAAEP